MGRGRGNGSGGSDSFGLPNQSTILATRARYIFVKYVVFGKRNSVSEADPRSFVACKNIFFNAWLFRTSRDEDRSGAFS